MPLTSAAAASSSSPPNRFDITTLSPPGKGLPSQEDEAGMLKSVKRISDLVATEVDAGIPADRIVVGGFSQGACSEGEASRTKTNDAIGLAGAVIGLLTSLTMERKIAGVITLSGWLALSDKIHMVRFTSYSGSRSSRRNLRPEGGAHSTGRC